jgi:hypothetical protein
VFLYIVIKYIFVIINAYKKFLTMQTPDHTTCNQAYNYRSLESYFEEISDPQQTACHLGHLLHFLVHYEHTEGFQEYYHIYSEIFELQQVLQTMTRTDEHGNQ